MASSQTYQPVATSQEQADGDHLENQVIDKGATTSSPNQRTVPEMPSLPEKQTEDAIIAQKLKILIVVVSYFVVSM